MGPVILEYKPNICPVLPIGRGSWGFVNLNINPGGNYIAQGEFIRVLKEHMLGIGLSTIILDDKYDLMTAIELHNLALKLPNLVAASIGYTTCDLYNALNMQCNELEIYPDLIESKEILNYLQTSKAFTTICKPVSEPPSEPISTPKPKSRFWYYMAGLGMLGATIIYYASKGKSR